MRSFVVALSLVAAGALSACGSGRRGGGLDAGSDEVDGGAMSRDAGPDARWPSSDAGGAVDAGAGDAAGVDAGSIVGVDAGGAVDAGATTPPAFCQRGCMVAADCASATALYDASHYACEAGACRWLGCRADAECTSAFGSSRYACRAVDGLSLCVQTCSAPADCGSTAAFDADNFACEAGACRYLGCNDDAECASSFASARYVCRDVLPPDVGVPIPTALRNCVLGCTAASDCTTGSAAFDADNYECAAGGGCRYTGCNSDAECTASFMSSAYVCR